MTPPPGTTCSTCPATPPPRRSARPGRARSPTSSPATAASTPSTAPPRCCSTPRRGRRTTPASPRPRWSRKAPRRLSRTLLEEAGSRDTTSSFLDQRWRAPRRGVPAWLLAGLGVVAAALVAVDRLDVAAGGRGERRGRPRRPDRGGARRRTRAVLRLREPRGRPEGRQGGDDGRYRAEYDKLFALIEDNAPQTETRVGAEVVVLRHRPRHRRARAGAGLRGPADHQQAERRTDGLQGPGDALDAARRRRRGWSTTWSPHPSRADLSSGWRPPPRRVLLDPAGSAGHHHRQRVSMSDPGFDPVFEARHELR